MQWMITNVNLFSTVESENSFTDRNNNDAWYWCFLLFIYLLIFWAAFDTKAALLAMQILVPKEAVVLRRCESETWKSRW